MRDTALPTRCFLFLQGPHGPFFQQLARVLSWQGARVWRVGFNQGDRAFWKCGATYIPYRGCPEDWPDTCRLLLAGKTVTDLVVYGDTRPVHAGAIAAARAAGVRVHVFEEGYLRPHWVTYERNGANGHSRLMSMSVAAMRAALADAESDPPDAPARWGDMRQHMFYGALYHFLVLTRARGYPGFRSHRTLPLTREFRLHLRRLLLMPFHALERSIASLRIRLGNFPFSLVLLQLEHDASFQRHGPFSTMSEFIDLCVKGFAAGAPAGHHLVFKAHPLEDGRVPVRSEIRRFAGRYGVRARVHFVRGGKLAALLDHARSAVTVNSTAGQQALWRGLPLRALGAAVYDKPELVSAQALPDFFAAPRPPDRDAYRDFRRFLLATTQIPGGFYSARGRRLLLHRVAGVMLDTGDPFEALCGPFAAHRQQFDPVD